MNALTYPGLNLAEPLMTPVARPSLAQMFAIIIAEYRKDPEAKHLAIKDVEFHAPEVVNAIGTVGTVLAPATKALNDHGVDTPYTVGGLHKALGVTFTNPQLDDLACRCKGQIVTNAVMAQRWQTLATRTIGQ